MKPLLLLLPLAGAGLFAANSQLQQPQPQPQPRAALDATVAGQTQSALRPVQFEKTPNRPAPATPQFGLSVIDKDGKALAICPLQRTDVKSDIAGQMARVVVTQHFSNSSQTPIEALYTFPLPHDAAVDGMTFKIGQRTIQGEIKKREEAAQIYQTAKANGQNAALLDQERPNIFSQRVANIMPGQQIQVEISFTQPITYRAGRYEWEFPTVVGPRYTTPQTPDADKITPPITPQGTKAGHDLTMQIHLTSPVALGEISSALHPITVDKSGDNEANIALKEGATLPNRDFVLRFAPRDNALQTGLVTRSDGQGGGWFQLVVQPPVQAPQTEIARKEMVFVIDQTGSQAGAPIEKAKETMRYCIENLNAGDTFQLLGFNTDVYPCFPAPVEATPANIAKAKAWLAPLNGGGGTDILRATDYALKIPGDPDRPRIVCFMTDGYVGNEAEITKYIHEKGQSVRMFPFGVGNSVNRFLIDSMAREGRGVPEYALLNEDGKKLAQRFYQRVANPVLLDVKPDWNGLPVAEVYPKRVPDVFESGPVVLTGRFTRPVAGELIVRGRAQGRDWSQRVKVDFSRADQSNGAGLPSAWARQKIEDLTNTAPTETSGETADDLRAQITDVALDYHLMSQYTSFVAVEPTVVNVGGQQKTVEVPVEMADGVSYDGIFGDQAEANVSTNFGIGSSFANNGAMPMASAARALPAPMMPPPSATQRVKARAGGFAGAATDSIAVADKPATPNAAQLAQMTPAERVQTVRANKMSAAIAKIAAQKTAAKTTVQLWLLPLATDAARAQFAAKLKALGWNQSAVLKPGQLVLGEISSDKLDELAALQGVRLVEAPKFG